MAKETIRSRRKTEYPFMNEITEEYQRKIRNREVKSLDKVEFICNKNLGHPNYFQSLNNHQSGQGCPLYRYIKSSSKMIKTDYPFMNEITPYWQDKIRDGLVRQRDRVEFICQNDTSHSNYFQTLNNHSKGKGCPECYGNKRITNYSFMSEIVPYWQSKIKNGECSNRTKVEFICEKHGNYWQRLDAHKSGQGCPVCNEPQGERKINDFLINYGIDYVSQKVFDDCKLMRSLRFDFYLVSQNIAIEHQGKQHYEPIDYFGGEKVFALQQKKDNVKRQYCKDNGIKLIEISYLDFDNIENILYTELNI